MPLRIGQGYDIHRLVSGRPLWLGCIEVPFDRGALGHSDGAPAAHAICDALLAATRIGDIGVLFPSSDARRKNVASEVFLKDVAKRLRAMHALIVSVDVTILLEQPKLAALVPQMRIAMARALDIDEGVLSVKAKSSDGVGPVGTGKAVAALAAALVEVPIRH